MATFYLVPGLRGYAADASRRVFEDARQRALTLPGVIRASYAIRLPAQANEAGWAADFFIPGVPPPAGEDAFHIRYDIVGPDYFETLGSRILKGRGVRETDGPTSPSVAVVNRTFAERMWLGEDPIGGRVVMGRTAGIEREIVGVVEDGRVASLPEPPEMYLFAPSAQMPQGFALLLVETTGRPESIFGPMRKRIAEIDAEMAVLETSSLEEHCASVLFEQSRDARLGAGVGLLGLALGMVGLYGVISLATVARTKEIGVRIALGARLLASRLHGIATTDPVSFAGGGLCLLVAALLASTIPALRATRIDPMAAIREE